MYFLKTNKKYAGIYNAGFENRSIIKIAKEVALRTGAKIKVIKDQNDPRSYRLDSSKLIRLGFKPKKKFTDAISEIQKLYLQKKLKDHPSFHSVKWLKKIIK